MAINDNKYDIGQSGSQRAFSRPLLRLWSANRFLYRCGQGQGGRLFLAVAIAFLTSLFLQSPLCIAEEPEQIQWLSAVSTVTVSGPDGYLHTKNSPPDPLPVGVYDQYPGSCGGGWVEAEADYCHIRVTANTWRRRPWDPLEPDDCSVHFGGGSSWTGMFNHLGASGAMFLKSEASASGGMVGTDGVLLNFVPFDNPGEQHIYYLGKFHFVPLSPKAGVYTLNTRCSKVLNNGHSVSSRHATFEASTIGYILRGDAEECYDWDTLEGGVPLKMCGRASGFRLKREKQGETGYIGACCFGIAKNKYSSLPNDDSLPKSGYKWINLEIIGKNAEGKDIVGRVIAYQYKSREDNLKIRIYASEADLKANTDQAGELTGGILWYDGPPPTDPEAVNPFYQRGALAGAPMQSSTDDFPGDVTVEPISSITWLQTDETKWYYGLVVSEHVKAVISPGNTITFEGDGIIGGYVEGTAASASGGAWVVVESSPGRVVYEASVSAILYEMLEGFVILGGANTVNGAIDYRGMGNWIGNDGTVDGPANPTPALYSILHKDGAIWSSDTGWNTATPPYYPGTAYAKALAWPGKYYQSLHKDGAIYDSASGWVTTSPPYYPGTAYAVDLKVTGEGEEIILHRDGALWSSSGGWTLTAPPYYPGTAYAKDLEVREDASYVILHYDGAIYDSATGWVAISPPYYPGTAWAVDMKLNNSAYVILHQDGALWSSDSGWTLTAPPYYPGTDYARALQLVGSNYAILHQDGAIYDSATGWVTTAPPYYPGTNYAVDLEVR